MSMNDFLTATLDVDLSRLRIVDDNIKVSRRSRLKVCSSFGRLDDVHKEVREDRWSRLTRQEKDSSLAANTKRPKLSESSSSCCLGSSNERKVSRGSSESSLSMPQRSSDSSLESSLSMPQRSISPTKERNSNAAWDDKDAAQPKMNKAKDSLLCLLQNKATESLTRQGNNGKNARWDNEPQKNKPSDAMMSLLNLKGSAVSGMSMSKSAHANLGSTMSSHNKLESPLSRASNNPWGMTRSSNNTLGGSSVKAKSLRNALGSMTPTWSSSRRAPNAVDESSGGNATFKTYKVPSKSSMLYSPLGAKHPSMITNNKLLDRPLAIPFNHY